MPVIRIPAERYELPAEDRRALVEQIARELQGDTTEGGPVIYEIPLEGMDKFDALVIWERWRGMPSHLRSEIILDAYKRRKNKVAQPLGLTYQEAITQMVLPYAVVPMARVGEASLEELKAAMLRQGGIALEGGKVDLRFPTLRMAEQAHRQLCDELPRGYWSLVESPHGFG